MYSLLGSLNLDEVTGISFDWSSLEQGQLTTPSVNVTVSGNYSLVMGQTDMAIHLESGFIEMTPNVESCVLDLDLCAKSGFTLRLRIRILELVRDSYFVSSGAEVLNKRGFAFFYEHLTNKFRVIAATKTRVWHLTLTRTLTSLEWYTVDFSWSVKAGLEVHVNNVICGVMQTGIELNVERAETSEVVFVAKSTEVTSTSYTKLEVEEVSTFTVERTDLVVNGFLPIGILIINIIICAKFITSDFNLFFLKVCSISHVVVYVSYKE